jgi:hypothetical protein
MIEGILWSCWGLFLVLHINKLDPPPHQSHSLLSRHCPTSKIASCDSFWPRISSTSFFKYNTY